MSEAPEGSVTLRALRAEDLDGLTGGDSPFADFAPPQPRTVTPPSRLDGDGALAVLDATGALAGEVSWHWNKLWGPTEASRCPMIGVWLRPQARGRGLGRVAQRQLAELLFRHTATNRVEAHTDVDNIAEQRALEAAGFTREGLVRGGQWRDSAYRDGYLYAILRGDVIAG